MKRLARRDRACLEYHLTEGHTIAWLEYVGEPDLATELLSIKDVKEALHLVESHLGRSFAFHGMRQTR